jgi:5-methylcytosine-specific restriction endonuclease McrA
MCDDDEFSIFIPVEDRERWEQRIKVSHTYYQWRQRLREYNYRCGYCGIRKEDTKEGYLTRDHMYPVFFGGGDNIENVVPACTSCNKRKNRAFIGALDSRGHTIPEPKPRTEMRPW